MKLKQRCIEFLSKQTNKFTITKKGSQFPLSLKVQCMTIHQFGKINKKNFNHKFKYKETNNLFCLIWLCELPLDFGGLQGYNISFFGFYF